MLELFHWEPNGAFLKPLIALHEKQIDYASRYVDLLEMEHATHPAFAPTMETRLNMEGEGPVLVHDGRQITESHFLLQYIEDAFPEAPALRPPEPAARAEILAWARFVNERLMPAINLLGCRQWLVPELAKKDKPAVRAAVERIDMKPTREGWIRALENDYPEDLVEEARKIAQRSVDRIEQALRDNLWLVNGAYSLADVDAFSIAYALPDLLPELANASATPRLMDWVGRVKARPAVQTALQQGRTARPERAFAPGPELARWG
jgi:glutathione S-transferase